MAEKHEWTHDDDVEASGYGWGIFDVGKPDAPEFIVQKDDDVDAFPDDDSVLMYMRGLLQGATPHVDPKEQALVHKAVNFLSSANVKEFERVMGDAFTVDIVARIALPGEIALKERTYQARVRAADVREAVDAALSSIPDLLIPSAIRTLKISLEKL